MNSAPETRYSLIGKLSDPRDAVAWHEFSSIYQPLILRIARSRGLQHADATDVTQEVLAKVARKIETFDATHPGASFRGWLYQITRNLVIDFLRREKRSPLAVSNSPLGMTDQCEPSKTETDEFQREFERQIFVLAAESVRTQVNESTWQAFWLTEINQLPVAQVAEHLGISPGNVYVARSRVFARLRIVARQHIAETSG